MQAITDRFFKKIIETNKNGEKIDENRY